MEIDSFKTSKTGKLIRAAGGYHAFVPDPLPTEWPSYSAGIVSLLSEAERNLGSLVGVGETLPNPDFLIVPYMRREAVLSSRIEGTQASLSDLFLFEAAPETSPERSDVLEVRNYVKAMSFGLKRIEELPLSLRLVRELHQKLVTGVRGTRFTPGEFRQSQNWIGPTGCTLNDARFVPPPVPEMKEALNQWEKFLHQKNDIPLLVQCALIHYQFEAIHPFLDGNGRVGRLLITLFLCEKKLLPKPLLYLSAYFERNKQEYYDRLLAVSQTGDWERWVSFFLKGVAQQAVEAMDRSRRIRSLQERYRKKLQQAGMPATTLSLLDELFLNPYTTAPLGAKRLNVEYHTARAAIQRLETLGILKELTGKQRNRIYCAQELLRVVEENVTREEQT
jgi:Fic family protein